MKTPIMTPAEHAALRDAEERERREREAAYYRPGLYLPIPRPSDYPDHRRRPDGWRS